MTEPDSIQLAIQANEDDYYSQLMTLGIGISAKDGKKGDPYIFHISAEDSRWPEFQRLKSSYESELRRLLNTLPPPVQSPSAWKGEFPAHELATRNDLVKYLCNVAGWVNSAHYPETARAYLKIAQDAYENAFRWLTAHGINEHPTWGKPPETNRDAERMLSEMARWLATPAITNTANFPANTPEVKAPQSPPDAEEIIENDEVGISLFDAANFFHDGDDLGARAEVNKIHDSKRFRPRAKAMIRNQPASPQKLRCGVYTRKSTDEGLEKEFNSLDAQRESGEAYIRSQSHEGLGMPS